MTFEIYKLEWILSRHTFGNTTKIVNRVLSLSSFFSISVRGGMLNLLPDRILSAIVLMFCFFAILYYFII